MARTQAYVENCVWSSMLCGAVFGRGSMVSSRMARTEVCTRLCMLMYPGEPSGAERELAGTREGHPVCLTLLSSG